MDHNDDNRSRTKPTSNSDLMSSAKVLVDAAKSAYSKDGDKIDKARVAGATADFLGAAKQYGKFEEKSFGKYVDKAESYLQNYHSSSATTTTAHGGDEGKHGHVPSSGSGGVGGGGGGGSGGYGEYIKLAQGLLNKEGHGGGEGGGNGHSSSSGGGGSGDYIKLAQGLLKKGKQGDGGDGGGHGGSSDYIKLAQGFIKKH